MSTKDSTKKSSVAKKTSVKKAVVKNVKEAKPVVIRKRFEGVVVSDAMDKTIIARVDRVKVHSKYLKRFSVSKKYKVHDEKNKFKTDDKVIFVECRPLSKGKRWRVIY